MARYYPCPKCDDYREAGTACNNCGAGVASGNWVWFLAAAAAGASVFLYAHRDAHHEFGSSTTSFSAPPVEPLLPAVSQPGSALPQQPAIKTQNSARSYETPFGQIRVHWVQADDGYTPPEALNFARAGAAGQTTVHQSLPETIPGSPSPPLLDLGIEVKEVGTGRGVETIWKTDWVGSSKNYYRTKGIELTVSNVSRYPAQDVQVMACWFGRRLADNAVHVSHVERIAFDVDKISTVERHFYCPILYAGVDNYTALREKKVSGSKFYGWAVLLMKSNEIIAGRGSGDDLNRMIKEEKPITTLLAAYKPDGRSATFEMPHWRHDPIRDHHPNPSAQIAP